MKQYKTRMQLKDDAKEKLTGHYGFFIGAMLFIGIASSFISALITGFFPTDTTMGYIIFEAISFIITIIFGLFNVGSALIYLKCACGKPVTFTDIFYGFTHNPNQGLLLSLAVNVITLLMIPVNLYATHVFNKTGSSLQMMGTYFAGLCIVLIIEFFVMLHLMPCFYLMLDFPTKSAGEILKLSLRLMKKHRSRLFLLELSFIPMLFLGALSFIGILWVLPYMEMTCTMFYLDIMKPEQEV